MDKWPTRLLALASQAKPARADAAALREFAASRLTEIIQRLAAAEVPQDALMTFQRDIDEARKR